ncbi:DsbA family protein [Streptomyces sp. TRM S81-3]|uniref:2-hydroxychromene-2-carboxylate isomerase n=1 Tax=Streptomyces griseicoloratus TaxID=2752516 RepID=A0A926LAP8_9ACTN|nr:DsbA family protein [Streptomyces griseicoloratus]MBD0423381.1 DsbA family protein [Streptomyces griseicoloratus]
MTTRKTFYFSLRSPYSWLTHRELTTRRPDVAAALEWVPYWEPDAWSERLLAGTGDTFVYTAMSRPKHFYILADVRRLATARGLEVTWPVDRKPVWEVPHLAYLAAQRHGRGADFADRVYTARWLEGRDICDPATMAAIGKEMGLDPGELAGAADDPALREEGARALRRAVHDGVFGVPYFIHGHDKYWGLDRLDAFLGALDGRTDGDPEPRAQRLPEPDPETRGGDLGHGGGCG